MTDENKASSGAGAAKVAEYESKAPRLYPQAPAPPPYEETVVYPGGAPGASYVRGDTDNVFDSGNTDPELNFGGGKDAVDVGDLVPVPPDGGYGWVIVIAAFLCNFIVDGIANSFGPFIKVYAEHFQSSKAVAGFIGACLIGAYLLVGPIVSGLVNKFGARIVVIAGSVIAGVAFILSTFSPNVYVMILLYGMLGGAGFGFIYLPAIVVVCFYFEKKRSMATGIAVAGSGAGTIVMPQLCLFLYDNWGLKVKLLVLAAISFSCVGLGLLYRPLAAPKRKEEEEPLKTGDAEMIEKRALAERPQKTTGERPSSVGEHGDFEKAAAGSKPNRMRSTVSESEDVSVRPLLEQAGEKALSKTRTGSSHPSVAERPRSRKHTLSSLKGAESLASVASGIDPKDLANPMNRGDVFYQGSIKNLPEFTEEGRDYRKYRESQVSIPAAVAAQLAEVREEWRAAEVEKGPCRCLPPSVRSTLSQMVDVSLLKESSMILLSLSNLFAMIGFYIPFMFMIDAAVEKGIEKDSAKWLLSIIGFFNTLGRVFFGWMADRGWLSALALNNISLLSCGVLTLIEPVLGNFPLLLIYSILFGFIISAYICLTSIVLTDLLGLDKLTNAFGILVLSRSIACFVGTPIASFVYEKTNSYSASFILGGILILLGGFCTVLIPFFERRKQQRLANTNASLRLNDAEDDKGRPLIKKIEEES